MVYNELEQGDILSEVRVGLASIAYSDISLRSIWGIFKIRQTPVMMIGTVDRAIFMAMGGDDVDGVALGGTAWVLLRV